MPVQFPPVIELSDLNGKNGFMIDGINANDLSGISVSAAGDINDDGISDLLIGAPGASPNSASQGQVYVLFGSRSIGNLSAIQLSNLNGYNGFKIEGIGEFDSVGTSVAFAGDVNNDGIADLIIGAPQASPNGRDCGQSYVLFGGSNVGNTGTVHLSSLNGSNGFYINGFQEAEFSGYSVSTAGDVNNDGIADLLIGTNVLIANHAFLNGNQSGQSYVIFGGSEVGSTGTIDLSNLNGSNGFIINGIAPGDNCGSSVASAGDVNDDGVVDLLIGAPLAPNGSGPGQSYVIFGSKGIGSTGDFQLSSLNGVNGFAIDGIAAYDRSGISVSAAGDINGDGIADLLIGAYHKLFGTPGFGQSYVIFGGKGVGNTGTIKLSSLNGSNGFTINGINGSASEEMGRGLSVSTVGDINADGISDVLIGASRASPNGQYSGQSYLIFGGSAVGSAGTIQLSSLDGVNGFCISGIAPDDLSGFSVAAAGDVNADGVADMIIGAPYASLNGHPAFGQSYVIFGQNLQNIILKLDKNQLMINQNQTIILTPDNLAASSNIQPVNTLQFYITNIQNAQFSFLKNPNVPTSFFYQQNITDGQIQFTQDGSIDPPSYTLYAQASVIFASSFPSQASINFGLALINNDLTINQGQSIILTSNNVLATNGLGIPNEQIIFQLSDVSYAAFTKLSNPATSIMSFSQADIDANQIQFVTDGTANAPSYSFTVTDGSYTLPTVQNGNIVFHYAPELTANALTLNQGQTILLNNNGINLKATDAVTPADELIFSILALEHGRFELVSNPSEIVTNFTQGQVNSVQIQFVQDGSPNAPSYNVSVINQFGAISKSQAAIINFTPNSSNNTAPSIILHDTGNAALTRNILIGASVSGSVLIAGLLCYISMGYLKNARLNAIAKNKSGDEKDYYQYTIIPVAKEIFNRIKITSFMNYISKEQMHEYVAAIAKVVHEMSELGINIDLQDMPAEQKTLLMNQMIVEMKKALNLTKQGATRCSSFFKPQVTPDQIMEQAKAIATSVRESLFSGVSDTRVNLPAGMESWQMSGKSKQQTGERTPLLSA